MACTPISAPNPIVFPARTQFDGPTPVPIAAYSPAGCYRPVVMDPPPVRGKPAGNPAHGVDPVRSAATRQVQALFAEGHSGTMIMTRLGVSNEWLIWALYSRPGAEPARMGM